MLLRQALLTLLFGLFLSAFCDDVYYFENGKKVQLTQIPQTTPNAEVKHYKTAAGKTIGVINEIIIECSNTALCLEKLHDFNLTRITQLSSKLYLISLSSDEDVFSISQKLYQEESIILAHPNFLRQKIKR